MLQMWQTPAEAVHNPGQCQHHAQAESVAHASASQTLMMVSREALKSRPSPPHRTALMACLWLLMLNRQRLVLASHTWTPQRFSYLSAGCQVQDQELWAAHLDSGIL